MVDSNLPKLPKNNIEYSNIVIFSDEKYKYTIYESIDDFTFNYHAIEYGHEVLLPWRPQKLRFDIDLAANPIYKNPQQILGDLALQIIEAILDIYETNYYLQTFTEYKPSDFFVTKAFGPQKYGVHIIAPFYMKTSSDTLTLAKEIFAALEEKSTPNIDLIDMGVYKTTQNFRLYNNAKSEDPTRKKVLWTEFYTDFLGFSVPPSKHLSAPYLSSLLGHYQPGERETLHAISTTAAAEPIKKFTDFNLEDVEGYEDKLAEIIKPYLESFTIRGKVGNRIIFNRHESTFCELCNDTHDRDNTMYMTIGPSDSHPVYLRCFRIKEKWKIIGHLGNYTAGQGGTDYLKKLIGIEMIEPEPIKTKTTPTLIDVQTYDSPDMQPLSLHPTIFLKAPMKMGKTSKCMIPYIKDHFAGKSIYMITFRQTFTKSIENTLLEHGIQGFKSYQEIDSPIIGFMDAPRLIIQVESLSRIQMGARPPPDLLIMDESESIIEQFMSGNVRDLGCAFGIFEWLLKSSTYLLAMDANLSERTIELITKIRTATAAFAGLSQESGSRQESSQISPKPLLIQNIYKNAISDEYKIVKHYDQWMALLIEKLKQDRRVAIFTNSLADAKSIEKFLISSFPIKKLQLYSSETSMILKSKHFADVNKYWAELDILICTPTVSAGISFEIQHFDSIFALFTDQSCTVETSRQMIGRVRAVHEFYVHFKYSIKHLPTDLNVIKEYLTHRRNLLQNVVDISSSFVIPLTYNQNGEADIQITSFILMCMLNLRMANLSKNMFVRRFLSQLHEIGAKISLDEQEPIFAYAQTLSNIKNQIKEEHALMISAAPDINDEQAVQIQQKIEAGQATEEDLLILDKNIIKQAYQIRDPLMITPTFVIKFGPPDKREQFRALKSIYPVTRGVPIDMLISNLKPTSTPNLAKITYYEKHIIALRILRILGFDHPFDISRVIRQDEFMRNIETAKIELIRIFQTYSSYFNLTHPDKFDAANTLKNCNAIIRFYSAQIKKKGDIYLLKWDFTFDNLLKLTFDIAQSADEAPVM